MSLDAVTIRNARDWALFLDVDGTLLEIAETPAEVCVSERVRRLLIALSLHLDGALALISGRTLDDLDRLFAPMKVCAAGAHGCERRDATGCVIRPLIDPSRLADARTELSVYVERRPGLLLEDKGYGLAVHFRRAPHLSGEVHDIVRSMCRNLGAEFAMQAGKCVFEIRPAGCTKGTAISALMNSRPFIGRAPIFIGDDLTDEGGFVVVNELAGLSIKVGDAPTQARNRLAGVQQVLRWLEAIPGQRRGALLQSDDTPSAV